MLEIKNLTIKIDGKEILHDLSFVLNKNDKLAIIGEEGNGKSTFLKVLYGTCPYAEVTGSIYPRNMRFGYVAQQLTNCSVSVFSFLFVDKEEYYQNSSLFYMLLKQLKLREDILEVSSISCLSGGELIKLQLLKALLGHPNILLIDEPTNDLDIEMLEWLEQFFLEYEGPIIYVSHDETLLSKTANRILHLELTKKKMVPFHTILRTDYTSYVNARLKQIDKTTQIAKKERQELKSQQEKLMQIKNKVEYQLNTITRADPHGAQLLKKKMKTVKAQEKKLETRELTDIPNPEEAIYFFFNPVFLSPQKKIIDYRNTLLKVGKIRNIPSIHFFVKGPKHIGIVGTNGIGKTTFLKQLYKDIKRREDLRVGYMPQNYIELLDMEQSPIEFLTQIGSKEEQSLLRSLLGNLKFTREEMIGKIRMLSGGSQAKLIFLYLSQRQYNVLLLDEPTRNLSPLSSPIIREALRNYTGAIISVSHDRIYLREVCDEIYELANTGLQLSLKYKKNEL